MISPQYHNPKDGTVWCPFNQIWNCTYEHGLRCPRLDDDYKERPVCEGGYRQNYAGCNPTGRLLPACLGELVTCSIVGRERAITLMSWLIEFTVRHSHLQISIPVEEKVKKRK